MSCDNHVTSIDPTEPLNLHRTLLNPQSATIRWDSSADNGGSPLFQYQVELQEEGEVGFTVVGTVSHPTMEYHLTLEAETPYM